MRAFADLIEVTLAAAAGSARDLTTQASVKTALKITDTASDSLIAALIPRVSKLIVEDCRLARAVGNVPTFAKETLRATWLVSDKERGSDIWLPYRPPLASIDSVVEDGTTLATDIDFVTASNGRAACLRRVSSDVPRCWSAAKIVVTWQAGFAPVMSANIEADLEAAAIEQLKSMLFGANRDPNIRSESGAEIGSVSYSVTGGDVMGAHMLLPSVRDMLAPWRGPLL